MKNELSEQQTKAILKALDNAIAQGLWDESNFLKVIGKNLREIRENFFHHLDKSGQEKANISAHMANHMALRSGQQEIFIALYSSDGGNLQSWERIITNLPKQMISRPIYAEEKDVREIIKTKEHKINEGYVSIYVNQSDLLPTPPDKTPVDRLGKSLLSLKDKSLNLENINRFVNQSGVYNYSQGRLIKNSSPKFE